MISAIVVPLGCLSKPRTISCLVPPRQTRGDLFTLGGLLRAPRWRDLHFGRSVAIRHPEILSVATAHPPSPPKPHARHRPDTGSRRWQGGTGQVQGEIRTAHLQCAIDVVACPSARRPPARFTPHLIPALDRPIIAPGRSPRSLRMVRQHTSSPRADRRYAHR